MMRYLLLPLILFLFVSCQYYNSFFNTEKAFDSGLKELQKLDEKVSGNAGIIPYTSQIDLSSTAQKNLKLSINRGWKLLEIYPDTVDYADDAVFMIARSHYYLREYKKAADMFVEYLTNYEDREYWEESWLWMVDSHLANGDTVNALKQFDIVNLDNLETEYRVKMLTRHGFIMLKTDRIELAINYFNRASEIADDDYLRTAVQLLLAEAFLTNGEYDKALVNATIAFDEDIDDQLTKEALKIIIKTYVAKNDFIYTLIWIEEGKSDLDNLSDFSWYDLQLGDLYKKQKKWEKAISQWQDIIYKYPASLEAAYAGLNVSEYYRLEEGEYDSAFKYISRISEKTIKNYPAKKAKLLKWRALLSSVVKLLASTKNDSFFLSIADGDSAFYYDPDNFNFLMQEVLTRLEETGNLTAGQNTNKTGLRGTSGTSVNKEIAALEDMGIDSEDYANPDSLQSILNKIITLKKDSLNFTSADSASVDSLVFIADQISSQLYKNNKFKYKTIEDVKKNYKKTLYQLSEKFLIDFEDLLSAQYYYRLYINNFPEDTLHADRALFALGYIEWLKIGDPDKNKYFDEVLVKYPDSKSALKIKELRGRQEIDPRKEEIAKFENEYNQAQNLFFNGYADSSLKVLDSIFVSAPTRNEAAKVLLMKAVIYKDHYFNRDSILSCYDQMESDYKDTPYYKKISSEHSLLKNYYAALDTMPTVASSELISDSNSVIQTEAAIDSTQLTPAGKIENDPEKEGGGERMNIDEGFDQATEDKPEKDSPDQEEKPDVEANEKSKENNIEKVDDVD